MPSDRSTGRRSLALTCAAALVVALTSGGLAMPVAFENAILGGGLSPDSIEHLAIAHAWVHGAGFVDPVQYHYYLPQSVPLPALAVRAPVVSVLAAIPLAAGATLPTVIVVLALWSALVSGAAFLVAYRFMRRRAAAAAVLLFTASTSWLFLAATPLNEVTATAALLLVLASAGGVTRSAPRALLCSIATLLAWLTRPTLGALVLAVVAAAVWELGPRAALRSRSLRSYAVGFFAGWAIVQIVVKNSTGVGIYAGYGVASQMLSPQDLWHYGIPYAGTWAFVQTHATEITATIGVRAWQLFEALCLGGKFNYAGWLVPAAVAYGLLRPRDGILFHRINVFALLGFAAIVVANYSAFDGNRYPLLVAVPACFSGMAMLDVAALRLERRLRGGSLEWLGAIASALPLLAVVLFFVAEPLAHRALDLPRAWAGYRSSTRWLPAVHGHGTPLRRLCDHIDADAVVAASNPWEIVLLCGNAAVRLPIAPSSPELRDQFIAERGSRYIVLYQWRRIFFPERTEPWKESLEDSERFEKIHETGPYLLYEVVGQPPGDPWRAPPPLVCAGRGPACGKPTER